MKDLAALGLLTLCITVLSGCSVGLGGGIAENEEAKLGYGVTADVEGCLFGACAEVGAGTKAAVK